MNISLLYSPEIAGIIMIGTVSQDRFTRRRFPLEDSRHIKRNLRFVMVFSHPQVFYPEVRQIICQTPCNSVDVILHGQCRGNSMFSEFFDRLKESLERVFVYNLRHIEIHGSNFYLSFGNVFF